MYDEREEEARRQRDELAATEQRREAVRIVQAAVRRQAAKMGKTVSDDVMHRVEERAHERFQADPRTIDQVRVAEAKRLKETERAGGDELRGIAAEVRRERTDVLHDHRQDHRDRMLHLRMQAQQAQDHQRADPERERTR